MNAGIFGRAGDKRVLTVCAWLSILLVSDLPDIVCKAVSGQPSAAIPMLGAKAGFLALFLGLCAAWKTLRPLRPFAFVLLMFFVALTVSEGVKTSAWWSGLIGASQPSFALAYLRPYLRDTAVALAVLAALWMVKRRRSGFYLVKGRLDAPIEPVRWLGIRAGESWRRFGWIFAVIAAIAVAVPTLFSTRPSAAVLLRAGGLLPAILLYAAVNAFNEEVYFRVSLMATLPDAIGRRHAMLINVFFFGLAHVLYGTPPGLAGFLMTGFLAWILGKAMLETKGFFWPWFIHFLPDVVIFYSYGMAWVRP